MSLFAGMLGLAALLPLVGIMNRFVVLPEEATPIKVPPQMPFVTLWLGLVMSSIIAGVVEEAAFRGYMQGALERRYGPAIAILVNGMIFGLAHYTHHPDGLLVMLPFYLAVTAVYGGLAYLTNSILPGLVLHAGGDVFSLTRMWVTGQSEWQVAPSAPKLIWETGVDATFLLSVTFFVLFGASAVWAYAALARTAWQKPQAEAAAHKLY
jgi:membrane protease YdiL (CAAX protease family)